VPADRKGNGVPPRDVSLIAGGAAASNGWPLRASRRLDRGAGEDRGERLTIAPREIMTGTHYRRQD